MKAEDVINCWQGRARRGDILLALPKHGHPWVLLKLDKNVDFKVGHAGFIAQTITSECMEWINNEDFKPTVECWTKSGVTKEMPYVWASPHYVLGLQHHRLRWKWAWFKSRFYHEYAPLSEVSGAAQMAETRLGKSYVKFYMFTRAKWFAPNYFTCTTLVWWSVKHSYGINVSRPWLSLVTPSDIYMSRNTYIRATLNPK